MWYLVCVVLLYMLGGGEGYGNGAPLSACVTLMPGHYGTSAQTSSSPYSLVVPGEYTPGQSVTVQITGADFQGFLIQARKVGTSTSIGFFTDIPSNVRTNDCPNTVARGANSATHNSMATKRDLALTWTPPSDAGHGSVEFVATVAAAKTTYWTGIESSQLAEASAATTQRVTTAKRTTQKPTTRQRDTTRQRTQHLTTEPAVEKVLLATVSGWTFYKVQASGPMTNANVKSACESAGLSLPCYINRDMCTETPYWTNDCITVGNANSTCRQTQRLVSEVICGGARPGSCEAMNNVFAYMPGWQNDGSACGVATTTNTWCSRGTSYFNLYAFCAAESTVVPTTPVATTKGKEKVTGGSTVTMATVFNLLVAILPACLTRMLM